MENAIKVRDWIKNFIEGKYDDADVRTQCDAGWYDWFCRDASLANKTIRMGNIVKQIKDGGKVDLDTHYVWFKNNCPVSGPLYDDFRFADIATGNTMFTIMIEDKRRNSTYVVYGRRNDFEKPLFETNSSRELVKWFNTPWEVK